MGAPSANANQIIESKDSLIDWFESGNKPYLLHCPTVPLES